VHGSHVHWNGLLMPLRSKWFWIVAIPLLLVGLYALLGFKVAPGILRDQAQKFVRENYGRELSVGEISIQPFKLQLDVRDLALPDADGGPMLGFERLFVDFEISSLWNRAYTFRQVTLEVPLLRAVIRPEGAANLADLVLPEDPEAADEPLPTVWIQHLEVERGLVDFVDQARRVPFERQFQAVGFELANFRTTPEGGDFKLSARSRDEETFDWKGRFALEPAIASQGEFEVGALRAPELLDFLGDSRPFTSTSGVMDLAGSYRLTLGEQIELEVELPTIDVRDLSLVARDADAPWVRIPSVSVAGVKAAMPANTVTIEKVAVDALQAQAWMDPDGSINLERLFAAPADLPDSSPSPAEAAGPAAPAAAAAADRPWTVQVAGIELTNAAIDFEDRAIAPGTAFRIAPLNLRMSEASLDLSRPVPVTLDAMINDHARFDAKGTLTPDPLAADLDIRLAKARMTILQPYVLPLADLTITDGELNVEGKAQLAPPGGDGPELAFAGEVAVVGFKSVDNAQKQDLVNFAKVDLRQVRYAMAPDSLSIDRVGVVQPYARVIISPEQVLNIAAVLDPQGTAKALEERRAAEAAETARTPAERRRLEQEKKAAEKAAAQQKKADARARKDGKAPAQAAPRLAEVPPDTFPIRIRELRIDRGRMNFTDNFIQPNFSANVQRLSGTVTNLSSAWDSRAKVDLKGSLEEFSPVSIQGELQPFAFDHYTDVAMRFENITLPIFNPYSGPLAGYNIAKGKLTTDLHYVIRDRQLDAQHKIRIDQLEWGEATATKGEATLPIKFATSLLKDRDGVINLDVPVGGTLDDPTFRIGPIVWQIIKNIITKVVTAPFAVLGSLFEGAEEAQFVDFAPGDATIEAASAERLAALGKSLVEKPELRLDVPLGALADLDGPALAARAYDAALAAAVAARHGGKDGTAAPSYASLEPAQKIEVLTALVTAQTGVAPQVPAPAAPPEGTSRQEAKALADAATVDYLEQAAKSAVTVPDSELAQLGEERAAAIERALLTETGLDPSRVFKVRDGKISSSEGRIRFELGLQ